MAESTLLTRTAEAIEVYFATYSATVIELTVPDSPEGKSIDTYFDLDRVEIHDESLLVAHLGGSWSLSLTPLRYWMSSDLFDLTIEASFIRLESSVIDRRYRDGYVRFSVHADVGISQRSRDENVKALTALVRHSQQFAQKAGDGPPREV